MIIKTQDYGESNKLITIFSKNIGKFKAIARGAKKPKSRMAAVTQPFIYGHFLIYITKGLGNVQSGDILDSFRKIREDIVKTAYAAYVVELTDKLLEEKNQELYIYDQFYRTMEWIHDKDEFDIPIMMYEFKLFQKAGFAPVLDRCVHCGDLKNLIAFSINEGGMLCTKCKHYDSHANLLPSVLIRLLGLFLNVGIERIGSISIKPENIKLLRQIIDAYYDQYGGYFLKSRKFLTNLDLFA